jgi:hypothetical protein
MGGLGIRSVGLKNAALWREAWREAGRDRSMIGAGESIFQLQILRFNYSALVNQKEKWNSIEKSNAATALM